MAGRSVCSLQNFWCLLFAAFWILQISCNWQSPAAMPTRLQVSGMYTWQHVACSKFFITCFQTSSSFLESGALAKAACVALNHATQIFDTATRAAPSGSKGCQEQNLLQFKSCTYPGFSLKGTHPSVWPACACDFKRLSFLSLRHAAAELYSAHTEHACKATLPAISMGTSSGRSPGWPGSICVLKLDCF